MKSSRVFYVRIQFNVSFKYLDFAILRMPEDSKFTTKASKPDMERAKP